MQPEIGEVIYIQSYKHDGSLHRTWSSATVLDVDEEKIVVITYKTWVVEADGRKWFTREPAICFYFFNRWYNVISMIRKNGVHFYCNLASPSVYDGEALKNIDYDLDVKLFPNNKVLLLDEDEFALHQVMMDYPKEIIDIVLKETQSLINLTRYRHAPFKQEIVYGYFNQYFEINELDQR